MSVLQSSDLKGIVGNSGPIPVSATLLALFSFTELRTIQGTKILLIFLLSGSACAPSSSYKEQQIRSPNKSILT
jgi:hypothetical protein